MEEIDLKRNNIILIPPGIDKLNKLRSLNLANCKLSQKALSEIYKVESLKTLQLENNQLEDIPPGIDNLKNLEILTIWGNNISPENILKIKKLLPHTSVVEKRFTDKYLSGI